MHVHKEHLEEEPVTADNSPQTLHVKEEQPLLTAVDECSVRALNWHVFVNNAGDWSRMSSHEAKIPQHLMPAQFVGNFSCEIVVTQTDR